METRYRTVILLITAYEGFIGVCFVRYRDQCMETEDSNPLECYECKGVLLPDRAMRLQNGGCVLRYICMGCHSRSYAVSIGSAVRVYPSRAVESVKDALELIA